MKSRYEAYMDGIALSSIHPGILITDIAHTISSPKRQLQSFANRNGLQIVSTTSESTGVEIMFELRLYKMQDRQVALQKIQQWARGSILETNDREGQRLNVVCENFPSIGSAMGWNDALSVGFMAYEKPFWESKSFYSASMSGSDSEGVLYVPGTAGNTLAECIIEPSQTIDELTVTVANTFIKLTGLNTDQEIRIGYDSHGNQYIKAGDTSILAKRTPASSDDLIAVCGEKNAISVSADASVFATVKARGLWL